MKSVYELVTMKDANLCFLLDHLGQLGLEGGQSRMKAATLRVFVRSGYISEGTHALYKMPALAPMKDLWLENTYSFLPSPLSPTRLPIAPRLMAELSG